MAWEKPSAVLTARFDALLPQAAGVERRQMFGCPCAFVNGNMFCGLRKYVVIEDALERSVSDVGEWMRKALEYAQTLPAKAKQPSTAKTKPARAAKTSKPRRRRTPSGAWQGVSL